jgi:hypothetical protein
LRVRCDSFRKARFLCKSRAMGYAGL